MDSAKSQKDKKLTIGTDGLTKKERRALKVAAAKTNSNSTNALNTDLADSPTKNKNVKTDSRVHHEPSIILEESVKIGNEKRLPKQTPNNDNKISVAPTDNKQISKAELRSQRRAIQEAQRLVKVNAINTNQSKADVEDKEKEKKVKPNEKGQKNSMKDIHKIKKDNISKESAKEQMTTVKVGSKRLSPKKDIVRPSDRYKLPLFNHLYLHNINSINDENPLIYEITVHSAFLKLGVQYSTKTILGSNARCLALLSALKYLITDFTTPSKQEFCRSLETTLQMCINHLNNSRPLAVSMTNAIRHFKLFLTKVDTNLSDNVKRNLLVDCIDTYIYEEIAKAGEAISLQVRKKISNGDIILTYGYSSLIKKILLDAHAEGKTFKVIIVDGRPLFEGREMLRKLVCAGVDCSYILINAISFIMSRVSKVLLGAHALLANGYVMSRTGTAQIALMANAYKKPILVCCETYKFCERVQTDSFVYNEIDDPNKLATIEQSEEPSMLMNWKDTNCLKPLNLMYDVTPPDLVTAVVTELAILPCTSVPVILRIKPTEMLT